MGGKQERRSIFLAVWLIAGGISVAASPRRARQGPLSTAEIISCRAIEVGTSKVFGVRLVIFHHQEPSDRGRLGAFLRAHNGATVEMQAQNGLWQTATMLRLKTCFGRGLLVVPLSAAPVAAGERFVLRFPPHSKP